MRHVCTNERGISKSLLFAWIVYEMWASGKEKIKPSFVLLRICLYITENSRLLNCVFLVSKFDFIACPAAVDKHHFQIRRYPADDVVASTFWFGW